MSPSQEDYLKTILIIQKQLGYVRSTDIANYLSVTKPSVSRAVHLLEDNGFIVFDEHRFIQLTPAGFERANTIYQRQCTLQALLIFLGVDAQTAAKDACRLEHTLSAQSFACLKNLLPSQGGISLCLDNMPITTATNTII